MYNQPMLSEIIFLIGNPCDQLNILSALLTEYGYQVRSGNYEQQTINLLESINPDLILLHYTQNPHSYSLCSDLKAQALIKEIPILFVTDSQDSSFDPIQGFHVGASDYLSYPFRREEIMTRIEHQLTIVRLRKQLNEKNHQLQQAIQTCYRLNDALKQANHQLEEVSIVDRLTQLANRRYFKTYFLQEWRRCTRERILWGDSSQTSLSLIVIRIDRFSPNKLNLQEEADLQKVARIIASVTKRPADLVCRYSKIQLAVLLPQTDEYGVLQVAKEIYKGIKKFNENLTYKRTISLGVATEIPSQTISPDILLKRAFQALQRAVEKGGDRLVTEPSEEII
ncbi:diguanylate cyclase [Crocosphaera sp. UHCC 0190]|uniref:diguanylate cyclase domain-containing protein n=1 Tax=Crocosphaera sp. UHCC 0190 TaxID=3110246 RepID=UPI002B1FC050|nr:diguanylate cyclase [Crocosphaera sp. UHCC 0190]MEA5510033.1 diguanylate cyclase [Crocosphaera sp. UHCC 0190]